MRGDARGRLLPVLTAGRRVSWRRRELKPGDTTPGCASGTELLVVHPHRRMPSPLPLATGSCRFRSRLATWPDAGARSRQSPLRRMTPDAAQQSGVLPLPPVSARWKRQLRETRECAPTLRARAAPAVRVAGGKEILEIPWVGSSQAERPAGFRQRLPKIPTLPRPADVDPSGTRSRQFNVVNARRNGDIAD